MKRTSQFHLLFSHSVRFSARFIDPRNRTAKPARRAVHWPCRVPARGHVRSNATGRRVPRAHHARRLFRQSRPVQRNESDRRHQAPRSGQQPLLQNLRRFARGWRIGGIAEGGSGGVLTQSGTRSIQQGVGKSLGQTSQRILDKFLNILPTVTIREGHRVKIYLSGDLAVPDYANHKMPSDLQSIAAPK